jgi:hypothetical protein
MREGFEGAAGHPSRARRVSRTGVGGALAVREWAAQCRGADTGLVAQFATVAGMGSP